MPKPTTASSLMQAAACDAAYRGVRHIPAGVDKVIAGIAERRLNVPTLLVRGGDSVDFHEVGVTSLRMALAEAYLAGMIAGRTAA
jgi:hypothetical protein